MRRFSLRSVGLWNAVLRRIRWDLPVVGAAWALMLCATTLLASGALYGDAVAAGSLREAIRQAPAQARGIQVSTSIRTSALTDLDGPVRAELERVIGPLGGIVERVAVSDVFQVGPPPDPDAPPPDPDAETAPLADIAAYEGIERHAAIVDGRWAAPGASTTEATLSEGAAAELGVAVGDTLMLTSRTSAGRVVEVTIVGVWRPEPTDPYWIAGEIELAGVETAGGFTTVGPFVVAIADLTAGGITDRLAATWRGTPAPDGFRAADIDATRASIARLDVAIRAATPVGVQLRVETGLRDILAEVGRAVLVSWSGILVLVLQFAILAGYALILVAGMLSDRRRAETALVRSRGASSGHLAAMAAIEAFLIAGTAAALAPWLATVAVRWLASGRLAGSGILEGAGVGPNVVLAAVATAIVGALALVLPIVWAGGPIAGVRAALARTTGRTLGQRIGLDVLLLVIAAIGLWQLRLYGAPITRTARGTIGIDPLLVAAPGIGLLAGAVLSMRLIPRLAELAERVLVRGRGLVTAVAGRGMARRPLRYTRSALLLMLAAALGTFATGYVATWERSQVDQAAYAAGAEIRVLATAGRTVPGWAIGSSYRAIPGVTAAMPVDRSALDAGRAVRGGVLLGLEPELAAGLLVAPPDGLGPLFERLLAGRPEPGGVPLPAGATTIRVTLDAALTLSDPEPGEVPTDPAAHPGLLLSAVVLDGDGRAFRFAAEPAMLAGPTQVVEIDVPADGQLSLLELRLRVSPPRFVAATGSIDIGSVEAAGMGGGASAMPVLEPTDPGWTWTANVSGQTGQRYDPPADAPWRIVLLDGGAIPVPVGAVGPVELRLAGPIRTGPVPAIASRAFLDETTLAVGATATIESLGTRISVEIVGVVDDFPTLDPTIPFLIVDGRSVVAHRLAGSGTAAPTKEWWLGLEPGTDPAAAVASVRAGPDPRATTISRADLERLRLADPVPLGVVGILGLGSLAAMAFAAIGFAVGAAVSASERIGEFGILRALGLSSGQLAVWLAAEHALLLGLGLVGGVGLGYLLAWLVLPFATLTRSGELAVPAPTILVPPDGLLGIAGLALAILVLTTLILRRELLSIRVSDVLRGRDG